MHAELIVMLQMKLYYDTIYYEEDNKSKKIKGVMKTHDR
jgi:hypothetical protein